MVLVRTIAMYQATQCLNLTIQAQSEVINGMSVMTTKNRIIQTLILMCCLVYQLLRNSTVGNVGQLLDATLSMKVR